MSKELEIIADALLGAWETPQEVAAHVVSRLSDAGYSIVQLPKVAEKCGNRYPLSDPPLLCQRDSGHAFSHEALDASCDRFRWPNLTAAAAAAEEDTNG